MIKSRYELLLNNKADLFLKRVMGVPARHIKIVTEMVQPLLKEAKKKKKIKRKKAREFGGGRGLKVSLDDWIMALFMYHNLSVTHEFLAELLKVHNGTVSRNFALIEPFVKGVTILPETRIRLATSIPSMDTILEKFAALPIAEAKELNFADFTSDYSASSAEHNGVHVISVEKVSKN